MADIKLTKGTDRYIQPESERNEWNTIFGEEGDDYIAIYQGTAVGGPGNDKIEQLYYPGDSGKSLSIAYWYSPGPTIVNFVEGWAEDGYGGRDTLVGRFSSFHGNGNSNKVIGTDLNEAVYLFAGNDTFEGGGGFDIVNISDYWVDGKAYFYKESQITIAVSADGIRAVVQTKPDLSKEIPSFRYELKDVETLRFYTDGWKYLYSISLNDLVTPTLTAQQTVAAGATYRHDTTTALGTAQTIRYSFITAETADADAKVAGFRGFTDSEKALVRDIFAQTSALVGLTFEEVAETTATQGQIRFGVTQQANTKGYTIMPGMPGAGSKAGDIYMDVESMLGIQRGSEGYEALLHEIGHALGLRHPRNTDPADQWEVQSLLAYNAKALTVMATVDSTDGMFRSTWGPLDWAALQYLYGAKSVQTGNNNYILQPSSFDARVTLVDHGGTDTLDASLSPVGVSLDLRAGNASSVGLTVTGRIASRNVSLGVDTEIEYAVGTPFDDVLIGNQLDNRFWALAGNDWIEGGAGFDAVSFSIPSSRYLLEFTTTGFALEAVDGSSGFVSMQSIERLVFPNKTVELQTKSHDGYDDLPESLYHFFIVAFSAAPGVTYMDQLAEAYRYGLSIEKIVDAFISKSQFTDVYPLSLSSAELAKRLVENIVKGSASAEVKAGAAKDIEGALDLGWTRGKVIYTVFGNLAGKPISDATWGKTAQFFRNEIAVAKHYTEVLNQSTTDLQTLRDVLSAVGYSDDVTTEAAIEALISQGLLVGAVSQADSGGNGV